MKKIALFSASFLSITFAIPATFAATVSALQGPNGTFTVSNTDLAENATFTQPVGTAQFGSTLDALHDGLIYDGLLPDFTDTTFTPSDGSSVIIIFDLTTSPDGYDIDSIVTLTGTGNAQTRSAHSFTLAYSTVSAPTTFNSITLDPAIDGTTTFLTDNVDTGLTEVQTTINGLGLSNVAALEFTFANAGGDESMYREIDVYAAAVPEPATTALLIGAGALASAFARRRFHKA